MKNRLIKIFSLLMLAFLATNTSFVYANNPVNLNKQKPFLNNINAKDPRHCRHHHNKCLIPSLVKVGIIEQLSGALWEISAVDFFDVAEAILRNLPQSIRQAAEDRLFRNANDIGLFFKEFYGSEAGSTITNLLVVVNQIAIDYINAVHASPPNPTFIENLFRAWIAAGNDVANALINLNPCLPQDETRRRIEKIIRLEANLTKAYESGDLITAFRLYDRLRERSKAFGIFIAENIVKQFFVDCVK